MTAEEERDPIESLFLSLESVDPPQDFVTRVMARARQGEVARWARWRRLLFGVAYAGALLLLAVLAFLTGIELEHAGARDLISLAIHDLASVTESPGVYLSALADAIPWLHVTAVVVDLVVLVVATRLVLRAAAVAEPRALGA